MKGGNGKCKCACTSRLSIFGLAIAIGVVSAVSMALFAWSAFWTGHGMVVVAQWAEFFPGYGASNTGGWIGAGWGFLEGFVSGIIIAVVYNFCLCCCKSCCGCGAGEMKSKK